MNKNPLALLKKSETVNEATSETGIASVASWKGFLSGLVAQAADVASWLVPRKKSWDIDGIPVYDAPLAPEQSNAFLLSLEDASLNVCEPDAYMDVIKAYTLWKAQPIGAFESADFWEERFLGTFVIDDTAISIAYESVWNVGVNQGQPIVSFHIYTKKDDGFSHHETFTTTIKKFHQPILINDNTGLRLVSVNAKNTTDQWEIRHITKKEILSKLKSRKHGSIISPSGEVILRSSSNPKMLHSDLAGGYLDQLGINTNGNPNEVGLSINLSSYHSHGTSYLWGRMCGDTKRAIMFVAQPLDTNNISGRTNEYDPNARTLISIYARNAKGEWQYRTVETKEGHRCSIDQQHAKVLWNEWKCVVKLDSSDPFNLQKIKQWGAAETMPTPSKGQSTKDRPAKFPLNEVPTPAET